MGVLPVWHCNSARADSISNASKQRAPIGLAAGFEVRRKGTVMNIARSFNNWRKYRQTVAELGRMSTRELQDLGIERSDIRTVARTAVGF
jgi:uncharacterized protein YjiS (DUF1127 family)